MAINWGIALGQAAKTGLDMYERLGEEELRAMQRDKMRKDSQQEKALDALYAEKLGKVGKDVSTFTPDTTTPETGYYPQGTEPKEALPTGRAGANYVSDSDGMALKETTKQLKHIKLDNLSLHFISQNKLNDLTKEWLTSIIEEE